MKTSISKLMYVFLLMVIAAFTSCKGEIGPIGPTGEDGKDGINGINGEDGEDGEDGNANVIASDWITPSWSATNSTYGEFINDEANITTDFMDSGVLLSYVDFTGLKQYIYALPFTFQDGGTVSINFNMQEGQIKWWFASDHNYTPNSNAKFRYVLIPSSTTNKSENPQQEIINNLDKAGIDINNYYQVIDYLNLDF